MYLQLIFDYFTVLAAEYISLLLRNSLSCWLKPVSLPSEILFGVPVVILCFMYIHRLYAANVQFWNVIQRLFKSIAFALIVLIVFCFALHNPDLISRLFVFILAPVSFVLLVTERYVVKKTIKSLGVMRTRTILIGDGPMANSVIRHFADDSSMNYDFLGVIARQPDEDGETVNGLKYLGKYEDMEEIIKAEKPATVLIFAQNIPASHVSVYIYRIQHLVKVVSVVPYFPGLPLANMMMESLYDDRTVVMRLKNNLNNSFYRMFKFISEWIATLFGTILISPILLAIAIWIYVDSPGPVFFSHRRIGRSGKEFGCLKFRSMCVNAQEKLAALLASDPQAKAEWDKDFKLKNDPRITRSGAFLRKTSLDELPQIFNVLKGEMSLVGPRPIVKGEIERYHEYIDDYYLVRPGITGLWQTSGRNDVDYTERVSMDSWYVRNWSIWIDMVILFRTFKVAIKGKGAY